MTIASLRAALRMSRRDAVRAKGRTLLIMVMLGLPVLVITALLTYLATADVTVREGLVRELGAADLRIRTTPFDAIQDQSGSTGVGDSGEPKPAAPTTTAEVAARLPAGTRLIGFDEGHVEVWTAGGYRYSHATEVDLRDPMTAGMRPLVEGRHPARPGEVVVTTAMGFRLGDTVKVNREHREVRVVGLVTHPFSPARWEIVGFTGVLPADKSDGAGTGWLADTPSPATLADTRRLNEVGLVGLSALTADWDTKSVPRPPSSDEVMTIALVVFMVMAETVLLAGPAFAIGLRRRRTELAMISAQGGSKAHLRAIVLADGLLLGGVAALLATAAGTAGGLLLVRLLADMVGPADVPWWPVLGVAGLGVVSGVVAALVPAVQAARQDTAAVLAGRSGVARDRAGRPVLGVVLLVTGLVASVLAARTQEVWVVAAAALGLLGMVAVTPWLVRCTGRLAVRLPLALRLSVRDAARHRMRTASAVAAVLTATAGAVAMGIAIESHDADMRQSYRSPTPAGTLQIIGVGVNAATWSKVRDAVGKRLPGVELVAGHRATDKAGRPLSLTAQCRADGCQMPTDFDIGDQRLLDLLQGRHDPGTAAAFAQGKAVVFDPALLRDGRLFVEAASRTSPGDVTTFTVPAVVGRAADPSVRTLLLPPAVASAKGWQLEERTLYARHVPESLATLRSELDLISPHVGVLLERGYQRDIGGQLVALMGGALILVLGGTFAATALAAADMRPDLATVSAVGAPARTGRLVVAGQAGYIAGLGALVGAVAGVVPGIALAWASTTGGYTTLAFGPFAVIQDPGPATIAVPWPLVGGLIVLPLLAALVAGAFARTGTFALIRRPT